jgi:hypothetical protein
MYEPGARWLYQVATDILGVLIARITEKPPFRSDTYSGLVNDYQGDRKGQCHSNKKKVSMCDTTSIV